MHLGGAPDRGHLTYCTNIHPGETWSEVEATLHAHLPEVKKGISPDAPMGVGLRLSAMAARDLDRPDAMADFQAFLAEGGFYVFTINGFPYGTFHGQRVKEEVYAPDWSTPERLGYTDRLAEQLAQLLPDGMVGSVSTVPGTFKAWAPGRVETIADNLIRHAASLFKLRERTGQTIALALEPEPCCLLETIAESVAFFEARLFSRQASRRFAELTGCAEMTAEAELRRHLGLCYDVCHAAVEYEDADRSISALKRAGIAVPKLQLSSALRVPVVDETTPERLAPFAEPTYLHQTIERREDKLVRYTDLPEALAAAGDARGNEWRSHFHVPVFQAGYDGYQTTQDMLSEILAIHWRDPIAPHLEVETYTWDVLPERHRTGALSEAIIREMQWVLDHGTAAS